VAITQRQDRMSNIGEQIQEVEHHREGLLAVTIIVRELIAVVFVDVELLILNLPPRTSDLHDHRHIRGKRLESRWEMGENSL
jgi:hypothetical protein